MTPEVLEDGVTQVTEVQANDGAGLRDTPPVTPAGNEVTESPIPGEHDRPCFKVLDEWIEAGGMKYRPGVWSFGIRAGKGDAPAVLTQIWICSPLHVDAVTTDAHDGNFGRYLRFRTTLGKWRTFAMPMDLLRADGADLRGELLAMGVEIDPSQRAGDVPATSAAAEAHPVRAANRLGELRRLRATRRGHRPESLGRGLPVQRTHER
jgi:putative DNA primase/helicase